MNRADQKTASSRRNAIQPQVFSDPRSIRLIRVRAIIAVVLFGLGAWAYSFTSTISATQQLAGDEVAERVMEKNALEADWRIGQIRTPVIDEAKFAHKTALPETVNDDLCGSATGTATARSGFADRAGTARRLFGFLPNTPDWTFLSLDRECGLIDVLMPEWFVIQDASFDISRVELDPEADDGIQQYLSRAGRRVELLPTVRLGPEVDKLDLIENLDDAQMRAGLISDLVEVVRDEPVQGLCFDLTGLPDNSNLGVAKLLQELATEFKAQNLRSCVVSGAGQIFWKLRGITDPVDQVILRAFQEPWVGSAAAPLAGNAWFEETVKAAIDQIGTEKLVLVLGTFSVDWVSGRPMPQKIGFSEAMTRVSMAEAQVSLDSEALNSFSSFVDEKGQRHHIWMLDAVSLNNQLRVLDRLGVSNVALSDLGFEDPGAWAVLDPMLRSAAEMADRLRAVPVDDYIHYQGDGAFLRYISQTVPGRRTVSFAPGTSMISGQVYQQIPAAATIQRYGLAKPNQIVLTFDDGPHPVYTRDILDVLKAEGVPATFFLVGNNALRAQDLVKRIVDEGHEIGSHTFMHPNMGQISQYRSVVEVNSVQKLINGITGRAMLLYREPFLRGEGPLTAARAEPLRILQSAGYIIAGSEIVPLDWKDTSAADIVDEVITQVGEGKGNVIVLHDAGNDRTETVKAVPLLIETLRAQGYEFVTMAEILRTERDVLMPVSTLPQPLLDNVSFSAMAIGWDALIVLFWLAIAIGAGRAMMVLVLALLRRPSKTLYTDTPPSVTVIIPAYNEEVVIVKSVRRVLASQYGDLKVIVIDDGSSDKTLARVRKAYGTHPQVTILTQPNRGKWAALNAAYRIVDTEVTVCIDADTQIEPMAVSWLCRHFSDPNVGAVAGKLLVGNQRNLLTRLQALEYTTAQNIDRRAMELLNGMLVVPGAIGAWRVSAVRKAGLYTGETLSEDADLTVAVVRAGYRVLYEENAVAQTEAPARIAPFMRQRLRWSLGMLQVGWKHKRAVREGRAIGLFSLNDLAVFGYIFPLLAPLADLFFFYLLYDLLLTQWTGVPRVSADPPAYLFVGYLALPLMDLLITFVSLCMDRRASLWLVLLFPFQRLFFRQLLYFTVFRALLRALTGKLAKWQKADRAGFIAITKAR
jgi:cellulose synthase/poly-beta-1,6-N-acetylglucosamine synthase-like glycosyltransferase/peptidoglycan/xylan/chitin deacetylase (PgdA/CDA1 family)